MTAICLDFLSFSAIQQSEIAFEGKLTDRQTVYSLRYKQVYKEV